MITILSMGVMAIYLIVLNVNFRVNFVGNCEMRMDYLEKIRIEVSFGNVSFVDVYNIFELLDNKRTWNAITLNFIWVSFDLFSFYYHYVDHTKLRGEVIVVSDFG